MDPAHRVVLQLQLVELWDEHGPVPAVRDRFLTREALRILLQGRPVRFVVADPGHPPRWIPQAERFVFWKVEVRPRLVERPDHPIDIYLYPEDRAFVASEWLPDDPASLPIVLLESYH